jgi:hypothetical protein
MSVPKLSSKERAEEIKKIIEQDEKILKYRRENAYKLSPNVPFPHE